MKKIIIALLSVILCLLFSGCGGDKAVSEGEREFAKIAIIGGKNEPLPLCAPCGVCRQVMAEFCDENFILVLGNEKEYKEYRLNEVLPLSFGKKNLK